VGAPQARRDGDEEILMKEILVVLTHDSGRRALDDLRRRYQVRSVLPPRIAILESESDAHGLQGLPQVEAVLTGSAEPIPASLSESESTFVKAWQTRQQPVRKQRTGEGLSWDAEGFVPPDPPKKKP
jgi:hypothetical protein